jgi:regulator of protease activity HflC (stomatin/prohibitin superfamily)
MSRSRGIILLLSLLVIAVLTSGCGFFGMKMAGPGEVGIKVKLTGGGRGVQDIPVSTGRIFYNPWAEQVFIYPTYVQTYTWTSASTEGADHDESMTFQSKDGMSVNADVSVAYKLDANKVPVLYMTFKKDLPDITATYIRSEVRKELVDIASTMSIDDIYGTKKSWLTNEVTKHLNAKLDKYGFEFDYVTFVGNLRLPSNVVDAINAKIEATQNAIKVENELRTAEAEARKQVAEAEGEARSTIVKAEAKAKADRLQIQAVGGPESYIKLKSIEKFNPKVQVMYVPNGTSSLIGVPSLK